MDWEQSNSLEFLVGYSINNQFDFSAKATAISIIFKWIKTFSFELAINGCYSIKTMGK
jgi:hypothetical protein